MHIADNPPIQNQNSVQNQQDLYIADLSQKNHTEYKKWWHTRHWEKQHCSTNSNVHKNACQYVIYGDKHCMITTRSNWRIMSYEDSQ